MRAKHYPFYIIIIITLNYGCNNSKDNIKDQENWVSYRKMIKDHSQYKEEIKAYEEVKSKIYAEDFNYLEHVTARSQYLKEVEELLQTDKNDSLKLGVLTDIIASNNLVNAQEKERLFSQIDTNTFSKALIEQYRSYLLWPKYQIGDSIDVDKIYSYTTESEIPLELNSKVNIIFFWSSWCANCDRYYQPIDNLIEKYSTDQLNVIGISLDQKEKTMKKYEEKHAFRFKSYSDLNKKWKSKNAEKFGVIGIPVCLVIDSDKNVLLVNPFAYLLESWVDGLLG